MGHPTTFTDHEWRLEQLKFLFTHGLCEMSNVGVDLARKYYVRSFKLCIFDTPIYIYLFF